MKISAKKILQTIGIALVVFLIGLFALTGCAAAPTDYQKTVKTGGKIETEYMKNGGYNVSVYEEKVLQGFEKYLVYYPETLKSTNDVYPVIVLCNGSGTPLSRYPAVAKHFASHGFLVIGTEEEYDWNGFSAEMCIRYLELINENEIVNEKNNIFYQKIDFENIGIVGHSQGGVGVINAITAKPHGDIFKAAVAISPTDKELAHNLLWDYDATKINVPIMLLSGAGGGDDWVVTGEGLQEIYDDISADKVMLRRKNTPHGEMLYSANGYVTAWFAWLLQGDENAGKAFFGNAPEIIQNALYQDQKYNFS